VEASCQELCGTRVDISRCRERSPQGTRQHHVVFMSSTHMGHCRWRPYKSPLLVGSLWRPKKKKKKPVPHDLKKQRDSPSGRSLREILQQGHGSSSAPVRGPVATSKPAVEISAKGRDEPVVGNLRKVKPRTPLLGVRSTDTPLQHTYSRRRSGTPSLWSRWTQRRLCLDALDGN
jgi:hypothetical protein